MKGLNQIESVEISYFIHATEDEGKVKDAVQRLFSLEEHPLVETLVGHFGNTIVRVRHHISGRQAEEMFVRVSASLKHSEKEDLLSSIDRGTDERSALYIRFSKQAAMRNTLILSDDDPIRMRVKPKSYKINGSPADFYARFMRVTT